MSDPNLEWPLAIYYDVFGSRKEVKPEELYKPEVLEKMRSLASDKKLYDKSGLVLLTPVTPIEDTYHFRQIGSERYHVLNTDGGTLHDKHVNELTAVLSTYDHWKFGTKKWNAEKSQPEFVQHVDLDYYRWQSETVRSVGQNKFVRHDVFGQSNKLSTSKFHPWMAIEVIDTHFPSEETFQAFLSFTTNTPFIICFDFVGYGDYFFHIGGEYIGKYLPIISLMYLQDGVLLYGGKPYLIETAEEFVRFSRSKIDKLKAR